MLVLTTVKNVFSYVNFIWISVKNWCDEGILKRRLKERVVPELARIRWLLVFNSIHTATFFCSFRLALIHARFHDTFTFAPRSLTTWDRLRGWGESIFLPHARPRIFLDWADLPYASRLEWRKEGMEKTQKRLDYIHVVYIYKAPQAL